jgi:hypothetical protein
MLGEIIFYTTFITSVVIVPRIFNKCNEIIRRRRNKRYLKNIVFKKIKRVKKNKLLKEECVICLQNYKKREKYIELYCNHIFHYECIKDWFIECNKSIRCPLCNVSVKTIYGVSFEECKKISNNNN